MCHYIEYTGKIFCFYLNFTKILQQNPLFSFIACFSGRTSPNLPPLFHPEETCNTHLFPLQLAPSLQLRCVLRNANAPASPPTVSVAAGRITAAKSTRQHQVSPASGGTPNILTSIPSTQIHMNASEYVYKMMEGRERS